MLVPIDSSTHYPTFTQAAKLLPKHMRAKQGVPFLYHFCDGVWYDPDGMRTHDLLHEWDMLTTTPSQRGPLSK